MSNSSADGKRWESEVFRRLELGIKLEFTVEQFARQIQEQDITGLEAFLEHLVDDGAAAHIAASVCPVSTCNRPLPSNDILRECPYCRTDYLEQGLSAVPKVFYKLNGQLSRDIRWMIIIHGMNSRAPWQEAFSWEITSRLKHSAPIFIYKYGWATIEVLLAFAHRRMSKRLGRRISLAMAQAAHAGRTERPDIIAHSFGTHLFSLVLNDPEFANLKFGRIIMAGSIVRPDFDWARHLRENRVEAVLNHVAANDRAVPFAEWAIPGTGPSGKVGYTSPGVINVRNSSFGHSDYFRYENMADLIKNDGVWHSFLTRPLGYFAPAGLFKAENHWRAKRGVLMLLPRLALTIVFLVVLPFSALRRVFDP